jgi:hypothetical protein
VLEGKKKLLKSDKVALNRTLPRIKELSMKVIWPKFAADPEFRSYFPDSDVKRTPPRLYFFQILSAVRHSAFKNLIRDSKQSRLKALEQDNKIIHVDNTLWDTLQKAKMHENLLSNTESKRIVISKKKKE